MALDDPTWKILGPAAPLAGGVIDLGVVGAARGQIKPGGASDLGVVGASWNPFAGDFNGDGKGDILWRDNEGHTALWEMDGGQIKPNTAFDLRVISPGSAWTVER